MFQESNNNANLPQDKKSQVGNIYHFGRIIFIWTGAAGQPQLQRPPGRREWPGGLGECQPGLRGRGHHPSPGPRPPETPAAALRPASSASSQLQSEVRSRHLLLQTLPTLPHPAQIQLLRWGVGCRDILIPLDAFPQQPTLRYANISVQWQPPTETNICTNLQIFTFNFGENYTA